MSAFLKLDVFRSLPKDLTEPTFCGGVSKFIFDFNRGLTLFFYSVNDLFDNSNPPHSDRSTELYNATNTKSNLNSILT